MDKAPLGPGIFRARYTCGPHVFFYACQEVEAEGLARELEGPDLGRGPLLGLDFLTPEGFRPCALQAALSFEP